MSSTGFFALTCVELTLLLLVEIAHDTDNFLYDSIRFIFAPCLAQAWLFLVDWCTAELLVLLSH